MSLPPGFLDELQNRLSLSHVVGRKVTWDNRKSNPGKGDMWAPCPFHQEKTASFHVDDHKGFYYCFGCHAKGDAISFVRETENVDFMEAVKILAAEAGMPMPERDPQAQAKADRRGQLIEVMEQAVKYFGLQLRSGAGAAARDYLRGRKLSEATQAQFDLGFAPDGWQGLWDHLTGKGVPPELILACGLAKDSQKGGKPYDTFRNRIMFPIRDARGRCIAFGGRAMDPNDGAKYLNSPETELFDKSHTLYNHGPAREAVGKGQALIVAEGYMDVIALVAAGFGAAVAPLGTAVTEHQLQLMWRIAPEPVIALDGDTAGLRAAYRVIDLALPLLEAGKSLRFALMPEGKDPDDLLRSEGAGAVQARIEGAWPMVQLLWQRETEGRDFDSPERKAALDKVLREKIMLIRDPSIRSHYGQAIKDLRWQLFNPRRGTGFTPRARRGEKWPPPEPARAATKSSLLVAAGGEGAVHLREAVVLATLICCPSVAARFEAGLEKLDCRDPELARLRALILRHAAEGAATLRSRIEAEMGPGPLEKLMSLPHVALIPPVRHPENEELAILTLTEELAKLTAQSGWMAEMSEASEDIEGLADESLTWRLGQAAEARNRAVRSQQEDRAEYDLGENGARIKRDEKQQFDALLDKITFSKPGR
ncbi:MAG: DNA primase [Roseovarius sp.]|uniref:DNA primase n=1 Tax=Roseovarius sp. TaxID=1486281 RepID=UPI001B7AA868|nr:DNA primase [Roseovarius sp.]MBQ0748682.1 DNA primase [Roseovarius sp.]MBQ0812449.1 DNA primase [Roseovarius sp.]